jgi:hypothetical protein
MRHCIEVGYVVSPALTTYTQEARKLGIRGGVSRVGKSH